MMGLCGDFTYRCALKQAGAPLQWVRTFTPTPDGADIVLTPIPEQALEMTAAEAAEFKRLAIAMGQQYRIDAVGRKAGA